MGTPGMAAHTELTIFGSVESNSPAPKYRVPQ